MIESKLWKLENVNLFKILCPHKYKNYAAMHKLKQYAKDDYIYYEEDRANTIFLIDQGRVKIGYYKENGEEVIKSILGKGEVFGEKSILGIERQDEFAQALSTATTVCAVSQDTLLGLMRDNASISLKVYKIIGLRIKQIERRLQILLFKDAKTRLVEFLRDLKSEYGTDEFGKEVKHPYTQTDIAKLIGTSRPTLNIMMNDMKKEGQIDFSRKKIVFYRPLLDS